MKIVMIVSLVVNVGLIVWYIVNLHNVSDRRKYTKQFNSMEQLWLAFVMMTKYKKRWTGQNWEVLIQGENDER